MLDNFQAWRASNGRFGCWNFPFDCVNSFEKSRRRIGADTNKCNISENHGRWGKRGAIRIILHRDWRILARTEGIRVVCRNAYALTQFQFIDNESIAKAWLSGTWDTYIGSLWLNPHWDNWALGKWTSLPTDPKPILFWEACLTRKMVCQYIESAWNMTNSDRDIVSQAPMVRRMCSSLFVDIGGYCCIVGRDHNTIVVYVFYGFQC